MLTESQTLEFTNIRKDDDLKTLCAFAHGEGGQLLIGVNDQRDTIGMDNSKQLPESLPNTINSKPGLLVDVIPHEKDQTVYFDINVQSTLAPVSYAGTFYKRSGSNTPEPGLIAMTIPDKPDSRLQTYRLTKRGKQTLAANHE